MQQSERLWGGKNVSVKVGEKEQDPQRACKGAQERRRDGMCEQSQALDGGRGDVAS